jgi:serine/threonine protein kinase
MTKVPVSEGDILFGKYRVERVLGKGGMGVVVAARHLELGELAAIKFLLPDAPQNPDAVERFIREARASARLKGVHVVKVHDVGRMDDGTPYMIMEHLVGTDLQGTLRERGGSLPVDEVLTYMLQVCEAVAEAHSLGIVHRDLKPANMFLIHLPNGSPCVKVLDFGISKQIVADDDVAKNLTKAGAMLGSPLYMSPEQIRSKAVDARSDIWALGVVLFETLTGSKPFNAETLPEVILKVAQDAPPNPGQLRAGIPPELASIVLKCLEKKQENRFQTVAELMHELRAVQAAQRLSGKPAPLADPPGASAARAAIVLPPAESSAITSNIKTTDLVSRPVSPTAARSRLGVLVMVLVLVAGAAIGLTVLFIGRTAPPPPLAPAAAPSPSATEMPRPQAATTSGSNRGEPWWEHLPDGGIERAAAILPAAKFKWLKLHDRAAALERDKKHEEAQVVLREALDIARKQLGVEDAAYAETLKQLAMVVAMMGKFEEAEKLLREALQVQNQYGDPSARGFDDARRALVAVLVKQGKNEEAKLFWKDGDKPLPPPPPPTPLRPTTAPPTPTAAPPTPTAAPPTPTAAPSTPTAAPSTPPPDIDPEHRIHENPYN